LLIRLFFLASVIFAIGVHFTVLMLFNAPANAFRFAFRREIVGYVMPVFYQNWSFFAPTPIDRDFFLLVRGRRVDGSTTPWINVSRGFTDALRRNRLSSKEMLATGVSNAIHETVANKQLLAALKQGTTKGVYDLRGARLLYRVGASYLLAGSSRPDFTDLQVAIEEFEFPRFVNRLEAPNSQMRTFLPLPIIPFPRDVMKLPW
jgi:hypothetical protein